LEKILITGSSGFLGRHILSQFEKLRGYQIISIASKNYNLLSENEVIKMFEEIRPQYVVHLAAKSGGIKSNRLKSAEYYYENNLLITLTFHFAYKYNVKKILVPMGGCSYPAQARSPIKEDGMWEGYPQKESAGYSMAKKMALVLSQTYADQYQFNSSVIVPGNLYGEYDNFSLEESHVIPAMIRKFYEAKTKAIEELNFWGTGKPQRDFVYAGDVAALFPYFLLEYQGTSPVNISTGISTTIKELAEMIADLVGYQGRIRWDASQPDGQMVKIFSTEKLHSLGKSCPTKLETGLKRTIQWFIQNYSQGKVRL